MSLEIVHQANCNNKKGLVRYHITVTSKWARWRLKSPASPWFTQPFIRVQIKENIKAPRHWPLCGEFTVTGEFPTQRASNAENVSIWWRHHEVNCNNMTGRVRYCNRTGTISSEFHQPRLVIRTFHRQGRCSRGGHLCNEHSEEKFSCSYK